MNVNERVKKLLSILLVLCMLVQYVPVTAWAADDLSVTIDTGTEVTLKDSDGDGYYEIGTADELYAFAALVNGGKTAINAELTANINLENREWTPIGETVDTPFTGIFDGAGYTISNLKDTGDATHLGFIGYMSAGGVKNLTVSGVIDVNGATIECVGMIAAEMLDSVIYNCHAYGSVSVCDTSQQNLSDQFGSSVGGLTGMAMHSVLLNCSTDTDITCVYMQEHLNTYIGGIAGCVTAEDERPVCILNCYGTGDLNVTCYDDNTFYVGGIVAYLVDDAVNNYFSGTITTNDSNYSYAFDSINSSYVIRGNYCPDGTKIQGVGEVTAEQVTGYADEDALLELLNENMTLLEEIIVDHKGHLVESEWAALMENFGGGECRAFHWKISDGEVVHCTGTMTDCTCETCGAQIHVWEESLVNDGDSLTHTVSYVCSNDDTHTKTATADHVFAVDGEDYICDCGYVCTHNVEKIYEDLGVGSHSETCICGKGYNPAVHSGGTATCTAQAVCDKCGASYGELAGHIYVDGKCTCGAVCDHASHSTDGVCTVCGGSVEHTYDNGFCTGCGAYQQPEVDADGTYQIANAGNLYWFARYVNGNTLISGGETEDESDDVYSYSANAKLTENIVVNENLMGKITIANDGTATVNDGVTLRDWILIGYWNSNEDYVLYSGTFDGNGKTVSGLYFNDSTISNVGLFGCNNGTVKNVGVIDSYFYGEHYVGGVVGDNRGPVTNCYNIGSVNGDYYVGGVVGYNSDTVTNCYNTGTVSGSDSVGGVVGYNCDTVTNCYNTGSVSGSGSYVGGVASADFGTVTNCYYLDTCGASGSYGTAKTAEQFFSGEVAYLLGEAWGQALGSDATPVLGGATVYYGNCGGTNYSNTSTEVKDHAYTNGFCTACGGYEEATKKNGVYQIANAGQLFWFAELVNGGAYSANAVLTADIDLDGRVWTTICSTDLYYNSTAYSDAVYTGTFDGQGHVIKNFTTQGISGTDCSVGLFGTAKGATIRNLGVDSMTFDLNGATDVRAAAIVGQMLQETTVENCYVVNSTLTPNDYIVGGIAACNYGGIIQNCFTMNVTISANARCGNLVSDTCGDIGDKVSDRPGTVTNCWTDADRVVGTQSGGAVSDCYANAEAALESGEAANKLGTAFGQTIGEDDYPVLGGAAVYQVENTGCSSYGENVYSNKNEAVAMAHTYVNGFCGCGGYEEAAQEDGVYQIDNGGKLFWFAELVNNGTTDADAVLTTSIDLENRSWTPIGSSDSPYTGTFDGKNYSISNFYVNMTEIGDWGLFGYVSGATVQNFSISGTAEANLTAKGDNDQIDYGVIGEANYGSSVYNVHSAVNYTSKDSFMKNTVGGIVGKTNAAGSGITIDRCSFSGTIDLGDADVDCCGGIIAYVMATHTAKITNCAFYGTITSTHAVTDQIGGMMGYYRGANLTVQNCLSVGTISVPDGYEALTGAIVGVLRQHTSANTKITNNYYLGSQPFGNSSESDNITDGYGSQTADGSATAATEAQLSSGEIACALGSAWGQKLDSDTYPVLGGAKVYYGYLSCAEDATSVYTNTEVPTEKPDHSYDSNGFCVNCDTGYEQPAQDEDGTYLIANAGQLYWFARYVNAGNAAINAKLTADIVVNENVLNEDGTLNGTPSRTWTPIGYFNSKDDNLNYAGIFDGDGKTISGLYFNDSTTKYVGLFVCSDGTVQNVGIIDSYFYGNDYVGGVMGINFGTLSKCYNTGTVSGSSNIGGVVGWNDYSSYVTNCYNTGAVSGTSDVGGVAGRSNTLGEIANCYNTGTVSGDDDVGGVLGSNLSGPVTNCYYLATCCESNQYATAKTADQFYSGEVAYLLGEAWGQNIDNGETNEGRPVFSDARVYYGYFSCGDSAACYTNTATASAEKPDHTYTYTDNGDNHIWSCSVCQATATEDHSYGENNLCACGHVNPDAVALLSKDGVNVSAHTTLADAISAVADCTAEDNTVVKLLADVDLGASYQNITSGVFTLDLNGCTITSTVVSYGILYVYSSAVNMTVTDSGEGGTIFGVFAGIQVKQATLTIDGGSISGGSDGLQVNESTVTINGGNISGDSGVYISSGSVTITGGSITGDSYDFWSKGGVITLTLADGATEGVTFPGGLSVKRTTLSAILGEGCAYWQDGKTVAVDDTATSITGGDVTVKAECKHENATLSAYTPTTDGVKHFATWSCCGAEVTAEHTFGETGKCVDCGKEAAATVTAGENTTYYPTLGMAISAVASCTADDNAVVKLLADVDLGSDYQEITSGVFTLDLNGCTITSTNSSNGALLVYGPTAAVNLTVTDSAGNGSISGVYGVDALNNSTVRIIGGAVNGTSVGVRTTKSTVNIIGGTIVGEEYGVRVEAYSDVIITGGSITGGTADLYEMFPDYSELTLTLADGATQGATFPGGLSVEGTTLSAILGEGCAYWQDGKTVTVTDDATEITGGDVTVKAECKHENATYTCTDTDHTWSCSVCQATATEDHSYGENNLCACGHVNPDAVALLSKDGVNVSAHTTLADAISAVASCTADDNAVVKLLADVDLGSDYQEITSGVFTLDLNGCTITSTNSGNGALYASAAAVNLTVTDSGENGTISGDYAGIEVKQATLTVTGGSISGSYGVNAYTSSIVTITGGSISGTSSGVIANKSTVTVTGGSISDASSGVRANESAVTVTGGSISGTSYGMYVYNGSVSITGGSISGTSYGVYVSNSTVTITGGSISTYSYDIYADATEVTLTLADGATEGATFPGGLKVYGTTLNAILGEGCAYWQDGKTVAVDDTATSITGGDVTVVEKIMSLTITWGAMSFTYDDTLDESGSEIGWTSNDTGWVQVENTGNAELAVTAKYGNAEGFDFTGTFTVDNATTDTATVAVGGKKKFLLHLTGKPEKAFANEKIGTVTLVIN